MRILIVNDFASITGGASRVALKSAIGLAKAGQEVRVFAGAGPIDPELTASGVEVSCLDHEVFQRRPAGAALREGLWDCGARDAFGAVLSSYDPSDTVVHVHTNRDVLSASVPGLAIERGFPVVYTCHEYFIGCPYGAFFDQRLGVRCPERGGSFGCWTRPCNGRAVHKKLWSMTRSVMHERAGIPGRIEHFVLVSDFSRQILEPYLPKGAHLHRVDNPVEMDQRPAKQVELGQPFVAVGGLTEGKNPIRIAEAANKAGYRVKFVGKGPLEEELRSGPNADVAGWADEASLIASYRGARALVFVPIWPETQGLVVYEAAAQGLPTIVARDCAAAEFIERNDAGILVASDSIAEIADAMTRLQDDDLARRLGANAYLAFWSNPPTMGRHVEEILALYHQALERVA